VCVSTQSTISLVQVSPPTGNSYVPVPVTNTVNQYDMPAGSNPTVACGESETSLRYPTNQFAQVGHLHNIITPCNFGVALSFSF